MFVALVNLHENDLNKVPGTLKIT